MKIGIVSLGLIGGSLFKRLCDTNHEIYAVTKNKETLAKTKDYYAKVSDDLNILKDCEMIFVASPINKTLEILDRLEDIVTSECIVLDCASVKEFVMKKKRPYKFIGSHPMAGTEFSGFNFSMENLFVGAKWVLTPHDNMDCDDIEKVEEIIFLTGAEPILADAKAHDQAVALISHMPLLLSQALMYSIKDNNLAKKLASSGFRDMTRISSSNLEMAADMRKFNKKNIDKSLDILASSLNYLRETKDSKIFADIKSMRLSMYSPEGKNILK